MSDWLFFFFLKDPAMCCLQEIHFKYGDRNRDRDRLKVKGWKNIYFENTTQKKGIRVTLLVRTLN